MRFFDLHCDTITELEKKKGSLAVNDGHISLDRAEYLTEYVQDFAIFIPDEYRGKAASAVRRCHSLYIYCRQTDRGAGKTWQKLLFPCRHGSIFLPASCTLDNHWASVIIAVGYILIPLSLSAQHPDGAFRLPFPSYRKA